ncbi:hypothetical protein ATANTOWER_006832 [Ataeniobius toweri]|uniref:Uncharacterized protein n=1 Tax=Ataeniobius toweri TaxID=208326 RepID=A0ABU7C9F2_9TELE|nr:hypothetical protein [Ataeniobius toweri]
MGRGQDQVNLWKPVQFFWSSPLSVLDKTLFNRRCKVSEDKQKQLGKFWVVWEKPMEGMRVEIMQADHPSSSTCFHILCLPCHYTTFEQFQDHLGS